MSTAYLEALLASPSFWSLLVGAPTGLGLALVLWRTRKKRPHLEWGFFLLSFAVLLWLLGIFVTEPEVLTGRAFVLGVVLWGALIFLWRVFLPVGVGLSLGFLLLQVWTLLVLLPGWYPAAPSGTLALLTPVRVEDDRVRLELLSPHFRGADTTYLSVGRGTLTISLVSLPPGMCLLPARVWWRPGETGENPALFPVRQMEVETPGDFELFATYVLREKGGQLLLVRDR